MKAEKGSAGYIQSQRKIRTLRTAALFALVFAVFAVGMILNKGDRRSIYSIIAAVGCIPAAMSAVSMIMIWLRRPVPDSLVKRVQKEADRTRVLFELYITTSEKGLYLYAAAVRDTSVIAYAPESRTKALIPEVTAYLRQALSQACGYAEVTVTDDFERFMGMLVEMNMEGTEDPDTEEQIAGNLLALSL